MATHFKIVAKIIHRSKLLGQNKGGQWSNPHFSMPLRDRVVYVLNALSKYMFSAQGLITVKLSCSFKCWVLNNLNITTILSTRVFFKNGLCWEGPSCECPDCSLKPTAQHIVAVWQSEYYRVDGLPNPWVAPLLASGQSPSPTFILTSVSPGIS